VTEIFGASETGRHRVAAARRRTTSGGAWQPLPGVTVDGGREGRMLLRSPFVPPDAPRPLACADQIEVTGDGRFHLLGRRDGVLKIGGKRVALAEVERGCWRSRGSSTRRSRRSRWGSRGAGDRRGGGGPDAGDAAEVVARVRHGLLQWFDPVVVPRRIRVVPRLPREANGKLTRARCWQLFERPGAPRTEFVIREHTQVGPKHRFAVQVPVDLAFFRGHFAGYPVLPGVAQDGAGARPVRALHPELGEPRKISRLKFAGRSRRVTSSSCGCVDGRGRVVFEIARGARRAAPGCWISMLSG
jgi:hypothetical protein